MSRARTSNDNSQSTPHLGESWVIENESVGSEDLHSESDSDLENYEPHAQSRRPTKPPNTPKTVKQQPSRVRPKPTVEPELVMPSIRESPLDGLRYDGDLRLSGTPRRRKMVDSGSTRSVMGSRGDSQSSRRERRSQFEGGNLFLPAINWTYDVLGGAMGALKTPISYLIA
ncbi:MAG: hypothetical protein Q9190_007877, partial [Brigantiaea leucoxantha]